MGKVPNAPELLRVSTSDFATGYDDRGSPYFRGKSRPYVRWWWLSGPFTHEDIRRQLNWVQAQGFGGIELAWIYPGWREERGDDKLRPRWLSAEWTELVAYTKRAADDLGLGCDFTFGSSWPFGGSQVRAQDAAQTVDGLSEQRLHGSWEEAESESLLIVNHLSGQALIRYARPLIAALDGALEGSPSALFCDSLELHTERMWSENLWTVFEERFGYSLRPFVNTMDRDVGVRYDYRKLVGETMQREFFETFAEICRENNAYSRVQCHGAPADLLRAYACVDVPESESLLFPPSFSRIAASAAAWAGKQVVSAETFTCIYGFPGWDDTAEEYWKVEIAGDLRLLADALFANGVNQIVWHGMPYQPLDKAVQFYASVHVGPDSAFAQDLAGLNGYLDEVSRCMKIGETYGGVGLYLPFEDALMLDRLPEEQRTPGANFRWEMRYAVPPVELEAYPPLWVSYAFLKEAEVEDGLVRSRELRVEALYVDCEWMDADSLSELLRLANARAKIIWKRPCRQPGRRQEASYDADQRKLLGMANVRSSPSDLTPLLEGDDLPWHWVRRVDNDLLIFFAHPIAKRLRYPMPYGLSKSESGVSERDVVLRWNDRETRVSLRFEIGESLMLFASGEGALKIVQILFE